MGITLKRVFLDIETTGLSFYNPRNIVIGYALLVEENDEEKELTIEIIRHQDEEGEMLSSLVKKIEEIKPDEIVTYNGSFFDIPFILVRSWMNGVNASVFYRLKHVDVYLVVKEDVSLPRKSLDYVAWSLGYSSFEYPIKSMRMPQIWVGLTEGLRDEYEHYIRERLRYDVKALRYVYHILIREAAGGGKVRRRS